MRRSLVVLVLALAMPVSAAAAQPPARSAIFFYPWYSNPTHDGQYVHWTQGGHAPPADIASAFFPMRGAYSSGDPRVLRVQMRDIAESGVDEVVSSWWGRGSRRTCAFRPSCTPRSCGISRSPFSSSPTRVARSTRSQPTSCTSAALEFATSTSIAPMDFTTEEWTPRHTSADGTAAVRTDQSRAVRGARGIRRVLHLRHRHLPRSEVRPLLPAGACLRDPLRAVGRPRLRRAGWRRGTRMSKTACSERPTTRCGVPRFVRAPTW